MSGPRLAGFLLLIFIIIVFPLTYAGLGQDVKGSGEQQPKPKRPTLEERLDTLEKRLERLQRSINGRMGDGRYRMDEIEASVREREAKDREQDRRLNLGKKRMREIELTHADIWTAIWKLQKEWKKGSR